MTPAETGIIVCHVRKSPHDLYIGRERREKNPAANLNGSPWQNPYPLSPNPTAEERAYVLDMYRLHVEKSPALLERLKRGELLGKRLGCWCHHEPAGPEPPAVPCCHGDVLRELQAELYDPAAAQPKPPAPVRVAAPDPADPADPPVPKPLEPPKTGNVVGVKLKGDFANFPGCATVVRRVIYKEEYGFTADGRKVSVACAWNTGSSTNTWFVCLVAVGSELYAVQPFGQTKTCANVKLIAEGWVRETGTQLKKITQAPYFVEFVPKDRAAVEEAILKAWPEGIPTDSPQEIPDAAARKYSRQAENRAAKERATAQLRKEAVAAGIVAPVAVTPSLFDL